MKNQLQRLLLNTDLKLSNNVLEVMLKTIKGNKSLGAVVPIMYYMDSPKIICNAGSSLTGKSWPIEELGADKKDTNIYHKKKYITAFCGGAVMLNRLMLKDVGLLDEDFFLYFEDGDLSWRGIKAGWIYSINPSAAVYHVSKGSVGGEDSKTFKYYVSRNRLLILFKHGSITNIVKAAFDVTRYNFVYPLIKLIIRRNRKKSMTQTLLGIKIIFYTILYAPKMLAKRFKIIQEMRL